MALEGPALREFLLDLDAARRGAQRRPARRDLEAVADQLDGRQHQGVGAAGDAAGREDLVRRERPRWVAAPERAGRGAVDAEHDGLVEPLGREGPGEALVERERPLPSYCDARAVPGAAVRARRRRLQPRADRVEGMHGEDRCDAAGGAADDRAQGLSSWLRLCVPLSQLSAAAGIDAASAYCNKTVPRPFEADKYVSICH